MNISILGINISNVTKAEAIDRIQNLFSAGKQVFVVTPNPEMLVMALKKPDFAKLLNSADLALADGFGLVLAARVSGQKIKERITGTDFLLEAAKLAGKNKLTLYLLGGEQGAGEATKNVLAKELPGLCALADENNFVNDPKTRYILLVAMGHGKQERVAKELLERYPNIALAMGVGGAFNFWGKKVPRAPKLFQQLGLEWAFRLAVEPWRIARIWNATAVFMYNVLKKTNNETD